MNLINLLTRREIEILYYVAQGMTTEQIAEQLCLSAHTVYNHRERICEKLNLRGRNALLIYAFENKALLTNWFTSTFR